MMKAIITGSSKGLGLAVSRALREEGMDIAITSRKEEGLKTAIEELNKIDSKGKTYGNIVDFSDAKSIDSFIEKSLKELGGIDIVVNNVGIYFEDRADGDIEKNLEQIINVNLMTAVRVNSRIIDQMKNQKSGHIFNVISIAANDMRADAATYSISKVALKAYNDLLREELKKFNIRVTALYPGPMNTASWDDIAVDHSSLIQMSDMMKMIKTSLSLSKNTNLEEIHINTVGNI